MKKLLYIMICAFLLTSLPATAQASLWNDIVAFAKAGAIAADVSATPATADEEVTGDEEEGEGETVPTPTEDGPDEGEEQVVEATGDSGMCRVPRAEPEIVCEPGAGFLCVNTPEPGVAEDSVVIRGTIDRLNAVMTQISVAVQHEYTKNTVIVDTATPLTNDCWNTALNAAQPFCIDAEGFYAVSVPLDAAGPYTVSIALSKLTGEPIEKRVRLSRVVAPVVANDAVSFDPELTSADFAQASTVNVIVSLLGDCQFCDFIGASTGAVTVKVENTIVGDDGSERRVSCSTNVEQGGQGRFNIGVPVGAGDNSFTISVCSVALPQECEVISGLRGDGPVATGGLTIIEPEPQPAYDAKEYPSINWAFKIDGMNNDQCVDIQFNRLSPETLCAQGGVFRTTLNPAVGINIVTVTLPGEGNATVVPWTFGWGAIESPFAQEGGAAAKDGITAENAFQLAIPSHTLIGVLQPILGNVVGSDSFGDLLTQFTSSTPPARGAPIVVDPAAQEAQEAVADIKATITGCGGDDGGIMEGKRLEIVGRPEIGAVRIEDMKLEANALNMTVTAEDVVARVRLVADEDLDGLPDEDPLPLKLAFHTLILKITISVDKGTDGQPVFMIGSPYTDCAYKSKRYCKGTPAALIPKNFAGAASSWGSFVRCDSDGQPASEAVTRLCNAINSLNAQTGLVNEKVLDAINGTLACTGSASITHLLRGGTPSSMMRVGCFPDDPADARGSLMGCTSGMPAGLIGPWLLSAGVQLAGGFEITEQGIVATGDLRVGNGEIFEALAEELHHPSVGIILDPTANGSAVPIHDASGDELMRLALSTDALNTLFFLMTHQSYEGAPSGVFDIDLSETMFKQLGFDFVEQCDAFDVRPGSDAKPSSLCNIRPRVSSLLGTALPTYKYFSPNHPLLMRLRGNRALTPQLRIVSEADVPIVPRTSGDDFGEYDEQIDGNLIDLQLGGITISFYALEIDESVQPDEFGNPAVVLDAQGQPVIHSMRPGGDPDDGQIISFELTLLLAAEISDVTTDPEDTRQLMVKVRPLADRTRLVLTPVQGSNATTVPPESLVSALREKLQYAISIFSAKENAIALPLPKRLGLAPTVPTPDSLMGMLGLQELVFGNDGLQLLWDADKSFLTVSLDGTLKQVFEQNGRSFTETY